MNNYIKNAHEDDEGIHAHIQRLKILSKKTQIYEQILFNF